MLSYECDTIAVTTKEKGGMIKARRSLLSINPHTVSEYWRSSY